MRLLKRGVDYKFAKVWWIPIVLEFPIMHLSAKAHEVGLDLCARTSQYKRDNESLIWVVRWKSSFY